MCVYHNKFNQSRCRLWRRRDEYFLVRQVPSLEVGSRTVFVSHLGDLASIQGMWVPRHHVKQRVV